jgi:hypothetical protein
MKKIKPRLASWFPEQLHLLKFGGLTLFEVLSGSEKELGSNQRELKRWIMDRAEKHHPIDFRTYVGASKDISREELARIILAHRTTGAKGIFFLPSLPASYPFRPKSRELVRSELSEPIRFPRA